MRIIFTLIIVFGFIQCSYAQRIATLEVELTAPLEGLETPLSIELDPITNIYDTLISLVEIQQGKRIPVPFQIERAKSRKLYWMGRSGKKGDKRVYELVQASGEAINRKLTVADDDGGLIIHAGDQKLIRYQYKTLQPPAGVKSEFQRSGFIHPLWSPNGQVLTRIQPPDHYHHYGIWNPWTHVLFEGDTVDFWNLGKKEGTVRFANVISKVDGNVFSEFKALQEHVVFKADKEKVALKEVQSIRVYQPSASKDYFIVDVDILYNCATASPFKILEYRYAGFGWRTTEEWDNKNSSVLTSEGKTRKDADGTKAKWFIVQGKLGNDQGGVTLLSHPSNYNHPEPLRIWPENQYDRGDMFGCFCTTKDTDWLLEPGQDYVLKYRLLVFNGNFNKEKAAAAWQYYAQQPKITVKKD